MQLNNDLDSFQNGVDSIVSKCTELGSTPTASTPTAIVTAIQNIYTNRYNTGYNTGKAEGVSSATLKVVKLGSTSSSTTFTVTSYTGYTKFTTDNFFVKITSCSKKGGVHTSITLTNQNFSLSYSASTGVLTVKTLRAGAEIQVTNDANQRYQVDVTIDVYLVYI